MSFTTFRKMFRIKSTFGKAYSYLSAKEKSQVLDQYRRYLKLKDDKKKLWETSRERGEFYMIE